MMNPRAGIFGRVGFSLFTLGWLNAGIPWPLRAEVLYQSLQGLVVAKQRAESVGCANRLKSIMAAARTWSMDNTDTAPPGLAVFTNELGSPAILFCPANASFKPPIDWGDLNWDQADYTWMTGLNWNDPTNVACVCRIHEHAALADGSVKMGAYRLGWPWFVVGPAEVLATPGENVRLVASVTATALPSLTYQWRREELHFETNVVQVSNPDDPIGIYWQTNVVPVFTPTTLSDQTNATLLLSAVRTNDSGYYSLAVSNSLGTAVSPRGVLLVDAALAGMTTNEAWSRNFCLNNLRQFGLLGQLWAVEHQNQLPQDLASMTNSDGSLMFGWPGSLFCRSDSARVAPGEWSDVDFSNTSYEILTADDPDPTPIFCRCRFHGFYVQVNQELVWRPAFRQIQRLAGGKTELRFQLFAGATNSLQTSTDLQHWTTITNYAGASGEFQFTDTESTTPRFYRVSHP